MSYRPHATECAQLHLRPATTANLSGRFAAVAICQSRSSDFGRLPLLQICHSNPLSETIHLCCKFAVHPLTHRHILCQPVVTDDSSPLVQASTTCCRAGHGYSCTVVSTAWVDQVDLGGADLLFGEVLRLQPQQAHELAQPLLCLQGQPGDAPQAQPGMHALMG